MKRQACRVVVMAKAPVPGFAKTRLIPALGADGAARLAERLLQHAVDEAIAAGLGEIELCCTPERTHPAFARWASQPRVRLTEQGGGDLGERMARTLAEALRHADAAILIGTDIPALDAGYLRRAAAALADHDAVFGPTLDGGYALIGLKQPVPALFGGMSWSHPQVMQHTRERARAAGIDHAELALLADIDEPADLVHLPSGWL